MAVLGACRSGGGMLRNGEGIISLARGFFYAGCQSVLLSCGKSRTRQVPR